MSAQYFGFILLIVFILWKVYKAYFKPLKKFPQFHERALWYDSLKKYEKAIEIRKKGLELPNLTKIQRADFYFGIGGNYLNLNQDYKATQYFDKVFETMKEEKFTYNTQFERIIKAYINAGRGNDANRILEELLGRQAYDKGFSKLEKLKLEIEST